MTTRPALKTNYPGFFQVAYSTNDLDRCLEHFRDYCGMRNAAVYRSMKADAITGAYEIDLALAYLGDVQIEIIQPLSAAAVIHREAFEAKGFKILFHHACVLFSTLEEYDARIAKAEAAGVEFPVIMEHMPEFGATKMRIGDTRDTLGHYMEWAFFDTPAVEWMASIPRND